jgi:hypothetical protein
MLAMLAGHAAIRKALHYDPEQRLGAAEYYPRIPTDGGGDYGVEGQWDVNSDHTRAFFETRRGSCRYLQLARIPVRAVTSVLVDPNAKFGQQSGDFGSGTAWTAGEQYAVEWDEPGVSRSGILIAYGAWPSSPGTVKAIYRAGYSPLEFAGQATANETDANGFVTNAGVDASPIKVAALLACIAKFHTMSAFSKSQLTGLLVPGAKSSEHLGSYSYTLASGAAAAMLTGMSMELPPEAAQYLEGFVHYGIMALG